MQPCTNPSPHSCCTAASPATKRRPDCTANTCGPHDTQSIFPSLCYITLQPALGFLQLSPQQLKLVLERCHIPTAGGSCREARHCVQQVAVGPVADEGSGEAGHSTQQVAVGSGAEATGGAGQV